MHRSTPYTWPFMPFRDCDDIRCYFTRFYFFHHIEFFSRDPRFGAVFGYPAPGAVLYQFFYLARHPIIFFFVTSLGLLAILGAILFRSMREQGLSVRICALFIAFAVVFSFPIWFEFLLANLEIFIFLLAAAGVLAFLRGHLYTAAALIAVAGSIKIVPLIFLALFIPRKRFGPFLFAAALVVAITVGSLWLIYPDIAVSYRGINTGLDLFRNRYMLHFRSEEMGFDHSCFGAIKQFTLTYADPATIARILSRYTLIAATSGIVLFFTRIRKLPVINQVLCLTVAELVLPPLSQSYTLLNLYIAWGLLVVLCLRAAREGRRIPGMMAVFLCFAVLLSPQTEIIAAGQSFDGQMKCFMLLVMMGLALRYPFVSQFDPPPANATHKPMLVTQSAG
jgi:hypothetical protein